MNIKQIRSFLLKDNDPWGSNNNDGPPDLDQIFRNFQDKFKRGLKDGSGGGGSGSDNLGGGFFAKGTGIAIALALLVFVVLYAVAGFYIVEPQEQAVVRRFGKYNRTVGKGPHWYPRFIETVNVVNTEGITSTRISGTMLTKDENLVTVEVQVQYKVSNIENYVFQIVDPKRSLDQTAESALRQVVGQNVLDFIITSGRDMVAGEVEEQLRNTMAYYNSGIQITSVVYKEGKAPDQVKDAFDDATRSREDRERYIHEAEAYSNAIRAEVKGQVERILKEAESYKNEVINAAMGDAKRFDLALPEYQKAPKITRTRLYIAALEQVLGNTSKVLLDNNASNNLMYLPLDKLIQGGNRLQAEADLPNLGVNNAVDDVKAAAARAKERARESAEFNPRNRRGRG